LASEIPDDGFHEIQLNGKQLVFLFMAATVVSVVIFLCGVLVGRGVRAERTAQPAETSTASIEPAQQPAPVATPAGSDPTTAAAPPPTVDDLSYFNRLEKQTQPAEDLKPKAAVQPAAPPPVAKTVAKELPPPAPKETPAAAPAAAPPAGDGYVIQVAAMPEHGVADAMARRLSSKGYSAFVMAAADTKPTMYRVRIGKFKTKREAETIAARLQKEEQFKPWVTR
jgi:cell division septation protein DedD